MVHQWCHHKHHTWEFSSPQWDTGRLLHLLLTHTGIRSSESSVFAVQNTLLGNRLRVAVDHRMTRIAKHATTLRKCGQSVDVVLEDKKPKWVFKHSDRIKAKYCVIVAPDEYENGEVSVKDLDSGEQLAIKIDSLSEWAKES